MFLGTHAPHLDDKGRLILPAKYRDELAEGIVITKGQENCLYLFPRAEFERTAAAYADAPLTDQKARNYQRVFFAGAEDLVPDKQGRITIPPHLREYAGLTRECRVIGMNAHLEIWEASAWQAFLGAHESEFSATTREVRPGLM